MHWLWVLPLLGCGRIAFDPRADGGASDAPDDVAAIECSLAGYSRMGAGCYRIALLDEATEVLWIDAEALCEADGAGAHLATIGDAAEAALLASTLGTSADAFIGMSDRITEGVYLNVTGEPTSYLEWGMAEPDGAGDCGKVRTDGLADGDCALADDYLCEYDGRAVDPTAF